MEAVETEVKECSVAIAWKAPDARGKAIINYFVEV
jgi:hypothetical protein